MGTTIECYMLDPAPKAEHSLRRFVFSSDTKCGDGRLGYHNASAAIEVVDYPLLTPERGDLNWDKQDPNWPSKCDSCAYVFHPMDHWQSNFHRLYEKRGDASMPLTTLAKAPVGSMWDAAWLHDDIESCNNQQSDGYVLEVKTPGGDWCIDGPSSGGGQGWTRTGTVPKVTVTPSIHIIGQYHGFLTDGKLIEI